MTEVLEKKIEELTDYIKSMDATSRAEDATYISILSKILYRLDVLETEENVDVIEIKDRIKFLTSQIEDNDVSSHIDAVVKAVDNLKVNQDEEFADFSEKIESSRSFQEESLEKIENIFEKIENLEVDNFEKFNNSISEIKDALNSVKEMTQNVSEFSQELKDDIENTIDSIEEKFNSIINSQNSAQEEYKDFVVKNIDDIKGQLLDAENNIKGALKDEIENYSDSLDIPNRLEYLVQSISTINKDTSDLVGGIENLRYTAQEANENSLAVKDFLDTTKDDLKNNLRDLQEQFVLQMLQVFDNISFSSETEEIIDFVDESSFAIKAELETLRKIIDKISNKDDSEFFNEHFNNLCDLVTTQNNTEFNLLKEVAKEIKKITANSENSDEYSYSLPDVENDLAKIRLVLKEIQTDKIAKDEQDIDFSQRFEILNEDISSISKRTNKLILTAEETNKKFKNYLDEFKEIIDVYYVRNRQNYIEQKIDSVTRLIISNSKASQVLNEAFMHFAEWIDATSDTLESNGLAITDANEKSSQALFQLEEVKYKVADLENQIKSLNEKYEAKLDENKELQMTIEMQNKLMLKLEQKLDKFSKVEAKVDDETRNVIEYIASQTALTAENTENNKSLAEKLEFLEHKIGSLDKSIQKIISYIDEE